MQKRLLWVAGGVLLLLIAAVPTFAPDNKPAATTIAVAPTNTANPPTTVPTATTVLPTATPLPFTFARGSEIAGVSVAGLTEAAATDKVSKTLAILRRPLEVQAGDQGLRFDAADVVTLPDARALVAQAVAQGKNSAVKLPLAAKVDRAAIQQRLEQLLPEIERPASTTVISDAEALTQTFTFVAQPGLKVDVPQAVDRIAAALTDTRVTTFTLATTPITPTRGSMHQLKDVLEQHTTFWRGVAGFYVQDLATGDELRYNADTVFSGASVMKVPIMIFAYSRLGTLNEQQREWLRLVIDKSENIEANNLLAAAVGGVGTEDALVGVNEMSDMLRDLGLKHTYMVIPYESGEYLIQQSKLPSGGPPREGPPPYTAADPYLRTTPAEMASLFIMLDQCAQDKGPLIEKYPKLNAQVCQEMLGKLQSPHDQERMVAGIPAGVPVAHKGGWTTDFQGDIGIVDSPGGRYVAAIYIYLDEKQGYVTNEQATPSPYLADFSHTIYTFFNPELLDTMGQTTEEQQKQ